MVIIDEVDQMLHIQKVVANIHKAHVVVALTASLGSLVGSQILQ